MAKAKNANVVTMTESEMEAMIERRAAEKAAKMRADEKAAKAEKRTARSTLGFHDLKIDPTSVGDRNTLAKCMHVVEGIGAIEGSIVMTATGYRASAVVGACFGVPGDTCPAATIDGALEGLKKGLLAKVAVIDGMIEYMAKEGAKAAKGRTFKAKPAKAATT